MEETLKPETIQKKDEKAYREYMKAWVAERLEDMENQVYEIGVALLHERGMKDFVKFQWRKHLFIKGVKSLVKEQKLANKPEQNQGILDRMNALEDSFRADIQDIITKVDGAFVK